MTMTDTEYDLKLLKNQLFCLREQFDELYDSYQAFEVLIVDGDAVNCRPVLNTLNYRFNCHLADFTTFFKSLDFVPFFDADNK